MEESDQKLTFLNQLLDDNNWEVVLESEGITTQKKMLPGCDIACFRSFGVINSEKNSLVEYVWNTYSNFDSVRSYDLDVSEYGIICDFDDNSRVCRQVNSLPWPMWPRETVYLQKREDIGGASYIYMYSVECNEVPRQDNKYVRATINISAYVFRPTIDGCMVYRIAHVDPCGSIPVSLVNSYATKTTNMIRHLKSNYNN
ncbi:START domain containing protein [Tupanvirus deep ocean]|uniref:START domain containing protein n=2 Tax=Tupanvirus TaxID=2094720 RepID=A0AC62A755_9VIRU|nr:START domain containing protein [Tupanvirus deep ocean]QKU33564.1 START domain containing protein [Tupanvirus deep ocean]